MTNLLPAPGLFGLGPTLPLSEARQLEAFLHEAWVNQLEALPRSRSREAIARTRDVSLPALSADIHLMKYWFDPIASGRRLRDALEELSPLDSSLPPTGATCFLQIDESRLLVTPEGRATLWALGERLRQEPAIDALGGDLYLPEATIRAAVTAVHDAYRVWVQQRIRGVSKLLQSETATMRPTVAGLLLVLLINRNTSPDRRLPAPVDPIQSSEISRAITGPALAFARAMAGTEKATARGLDLYRGWALGEIARRLGSGFHKDRHGIWIDAAHEARARERLVEAIRDRPAESRLRVPSALDQTLDAYNAVRPVLSALGVAHERPANTRKIMEEMRRAASVDVHDEGLSS